MSQEILHVIVLSVVSLTVLFLLTKMMGYRQMSELSLFDYINGITIGSIAAELATNLEDYHRPLTGMIVYGIVTVLLSELTEKSICARRFLNGKPLVLLHHGVIYEKNLKKAKIDLNELLEQCRVSGYFDISKLQAIVLEGNGRLSFLPKVTDRPVTVNDLNLKPEDEDLTAVLVLDGHMMEHNLQHSGKDKKWLTTQLHALGFSEVKDVLLATCDLNNKLSVFPKTAHEHSEDILD